MYDVHRITTISCGEPAIDGAERIQALENVDKRRVESVNNRTLTYITPPTVMTSPWTFLSSHSIQIRWRRARRPEY